MHSPAAVGEANALAVDDTIVFDPSVTLILVNGQIAITSNVTIIGNGPLLTSIQSSAALGTTSRIFNITNFIVNLSGLTLSGGNVTGNGGAIQNTGNLTITNSVIRDNRASGTGGGIRSTNNFTLLNSLVEGNSSTASTSGGISFAGLNLTITNSTISANNSFGNGGGINISASVSATISSSTIRNNTAGASSGGFFTNRGTISNSTISGNIATGTLATDGGGGVRIQAGANSVSFVSCTITNNTAPNSVDGARSGLWHETGTVNISNTIIAANIAQDIQRDGSAILVNGGFNLIGENSSVTTEFPAGLPNGTNYVGTSKTPLDPMLAVIANNGGPTDTHAPLAGSVAIDNGTSSGSISDQRGFIRPFDIAGIPNAPAGDASDIGSVEYQSSPNNAGVTVSGRVLNSAGLGVSRAHVYLTNGDGNSFSAYTNGFGYFTFLNFAIGQGYVAGVQNKGQIFSPRVIVVQAAVAGLNFTAEP